MVVGINQINDFGERQRVSIRTETFDKSLDLIHEWFRWLGWVKSFDKMSIKTPLSLASDTILSGPLSQTN